MTDQTRPATRPGPGAARDAFLGTLIGIAARYTSAAVTAKTGDPELGEATGQMAAETGYLLSGLIFGGIFGAVTYFRKGGQNLFARRKGATS
jgi:hypothetical protein